MANLEQSCNNAINKTATYLRIQSTMSYEPDNRQEFSRDKAEVMIHVAQNIIDESEHIIALCDLDHEMTEGAVNLIIDNQAKIERLNQGVEGNRQVIR